MDRVFLDANVLFSAAYREGARLLALWSLEGIELVTSGLALEEARRNLSDQSSRDRLETIADRMEVVATPREAWEWGAEEVPLPENDRVLLATAVFVGATHFLTGDRRHFGKLYGQTVNGVQVLPPAAYLKKRWPK